MFYNNFIYIYWVFEIKNNSNRVKMGHDKQKQSTGSWKGNKDSHQKVTKGDEDQKKQSESWVHMGKNTNHGNNKNQIMTLATPW